MEVVLDCLVGAELFEQPDDGSARVVLVVQVFEGVDVVYAVGTKLCIQLILIPAALVDQLHEVDEALVENVELVLGEQGQDRKPEVLPHVDHLTPESLGSFQQLELLAFLFVSLQQDNAIELLVMVALHLTYLAVLVDHPESLEEGFEPFSVGEASEEEDLVVVPVVDVLRVVLLDVAGLLAHLTVVARHVERRPDQVRLLLRIGHLAINHRARLEANRWLVELKEQSHDMVLVAELFVAGAFRVLAEDVVLRLPVPEPDTLDVLKVEVGHVVSELGLLGRITSERTKLLLLNLKSLLPGFLKSEQRVVPEAEFELGLPMTDVRLSSVDGVL